MTEVLIVGAGPTGLTAAVELARQGLVPRIIDRRAAGSNLSRAVGISARSMKVLAPSCVAEAIRTEAVTISGVIVHKGARRVARLPLNFDERSRLYGLAQDRTEALLAEAFARYGGHIDYRTEFEGLEQDGSGVTVKMNGETARFDHVIAADGVRSAVRAALGVDYPGYELPQTWSIADVDVQDWPEPEAFKGYLLSGGNVTIVVPLETGRFRVVANQSDALKTLPVPMEISHTHREASFRISVRLAETYANGRVYLAGDAAHCHSPVGGRGMNLGIADAADIAARIIRGDTAGYHDARRPEAEKVVALTERGRKIVDGAGPARQLAVSAVLGAMGVFRPLGRAAIRQFLGA